MYNLPFSFGVLMILITIWSVVWKIYAAWTAARHSQKKWFVALLILNTAGILEIFYIFRIAKKSWTEVKADFHHAWDSLWSK